jgi:hypothetical protein
MYHPGFDLIRLLREIKAEEKIFKMILETYDTDKDELEREMNDFLHNLVHNQIITNDKK